MLHRISLAVLAATLVAHATTVNADDLAKDRLEDKKGSTTTTASYRVFEEGKNVKIAIDFKVKKTGIAGTGKGSMDFTILSDDFEPIFKIDKSLTVGAHALKGVADKEFSQTITLSGEKGKKIRENGVIAAISVMTDKDSSGIPESRKEWIEALSDVAEIKKQIEEIGGLEKGKSKQIGAWSFMKIK